jgi:hypothetical protein
MEKSSNLDTILPSDKGIPLHATRGASILVPRLEGDYGQETVVR